MIYSTDLLIVVSARGKISLKWSLAKIVACLGFKKEKPNIKLAKKIVEEYGNSSLDYFKLIPDKSLYFSQTKKSFFAYKVFSKSIMILGDPVGPKDEIEILIKQFYKICKHKNYSLCFFQASPAFLDIYQGLDLRISAIGSEALVDLPKFNLKEINKQDLRKQMRILDSYRYKVRYYKNPSDKILLQRLRAISDDWASATEKERIFSSRPFSEEYIKTTTVMTVEDMVGNMVAFANLIPIGKTNNIAIDLICKSKAAPEGTLEYLLTHVALFLKELGHKQLSLGFVSSLAESHQSNFAEPFAKALVNKMNFLFADNSLKPLKEKFLDILEPRYFTSSL